MNNKILISIFALNVEKFIEQLFLDLDEHGHLDKEIICLNNNSSDKTKEKIVELKDKFKISNCHLISHKTNLGYGYNKKVSFDYAIDNNFKKILFIHGDNQYPASGLSEMISLLEDSSLVYGSRFLKKESVKKNMPLIKYLINPLFTKIINIISGENFTEYFSGFRGYCMKDVKKIRYKDLSDEYIFEQQLMFEMIKSKMKITEFGIPTVYDEQKSKIPAISYTLSLFFNVIFYFFIKR